MAKIIREELWQPADGLCLIVVSTNATIDIKGRLVMGRGAARQARCQFPGIARECAKVIKDALRSIWSYPAPHGDAAMDAYNMECDIEDTDHYSETGYYFRVVREPLAGRPGFGIFQVKEHFGDKADLELIRRSAVVLAEYARRYPDVQIRMNYPGIGWGCCHRREVEPLLTRLPENVTICFR